MTMRGWRARNASAARSPRCDEPLSTIQNTRRAERYGSWSITSSTSRPKAALPVLGSHRPKTTARWRPGTAGACVLVLDSHGLVRSDGQGLMQPSADLDAGLLIGTQHVVVRPQRPA